MNGVLETGTILLGKYRVESVLGQGGMGVVLRVTHLHLGEELAVKVLLPEGATSPEVTTRFLREAQSVVRLRGEHVARVSDVGVLPEGLPFMVMEYLRGTDLAGELHRRGTLPPGEAVDYVLQACEALAEAHIQGIIHRDIKPANLFLTTRPDNSPLVKVLDFGISKAPTSFNSVMTKTQIVMGTPGYMSPEQMKATKDVDVRTDIWALGIVLYECLTGGRPFDGESYAAIVLMAGTEPPPPLGPRIPRGLQAAVLRCLEKDRRARFPTIAALAAALAPFARNKREATTIVERTNHILERPSGGIELTARSVPAPAATTLSAGAAAVNARPWREIAGGLSLVGAVVLLSILVLIVSGNLHALDDEADVETATLDPKQLANENTVVSKTNAVPSVPAAPSASPAGSSVPVDSRPIEIAAPAAVGGASLSRTDPKSEKTARCAGLLAEKQWPALSACAAELDTAGERERARSFQAVAMLETASEVTDRKVRQALSGQNLKEAQRLLKQMAPGSVYYKPLGDLFDQAESAKAEDTKRIIQAYLDGHDCGGLRRSLSHDLGASATERVVTMFSHAIATCTERTQPGTNKAETSSTRPALSLPPPGPVSSKNPAKDESGNGIGEPPEMLTPPDMAESKEPVKNRYGQGTQPATSSPPSNSSCDHIDANAITTMAENQFNAGYAPTALVLMKKALQCKESVGMYRLAGMYACRAHDVEAAKRYFNRVPAQFRPSIEQACQMESIDIRPPAVQLDENKDGLPITR